MKIESRRSEEFSFEFVSYPLTLRIHFTKKERKKRYGEKNNSAYLCGCWNKCDSKFIEMSLTQNYTLVHLIKLFVNVTEMEIRVFKFLIFEITNRVI